MYNKTTVPVLPSTDEEVEELIFKTWKAPTSNAILGLYQIFRKQHPKNSVLDTWLKTLDHIITLKKDSA